MTEHQPIPVAGYKPQSQETIDRVNDNKRVEEALLQTIDEMQAWALEEGKYDARWLAIARTHFEQGFMALNRAIFKPDRVKL
jgi:hypothetical protein